MDDYWSQTMPAVMPQPQESMQFLSSTISLTSRDLLMLFCLILAANLVTIVLVAAIYSIRPR